MRSQYQFFAAGKEKRRAWQRSAFEIEMSVTKNSENSPLAVEFRDWKGMKVRSKLVIYVDPFGIWTRRARLQPLVLYLLRLRLTTRFSTI